MSSISLLMKTMFDTIEKVDEPTVQQPHNKFMKTRIPKEKYKNTNYLCKNNKYMRKHHSIKQPGIDIQRKTY